ncbi:uncharacterized protein LOC122029995 isoform X1 [Zingiber officinale]|uniref:uncharacterized protein LOC122029995 isoform X1 n=1 Tax=Zingiber officinale TaxID=94328 RepID=UPI001C4B3E3B|nr:uncharacterized protein LOC122029995 isoform X1 [Zingiber officinale]
MERTVITIDTSSEITGSTTSPGVAPVVLSDDLVEELLRFTLSLTASGAIVTLPFSLSLSPDYCSHLLQPEPSALLPFLHPFDGDGTSGVPAYPLYKHLARAIRRCIDSGNFIRSLSNAMPSIPLEEKTNLKVNEWNSLISNKGSELTKMLSNVDFELHVKEPFFSQLRDGLKTVEGRCALGLYNRIAPRSLILFNKCLLLEVTHVKHYNSFSEMLQVEILANVLPGIMSVEDGIQVYRKFYTEEKEMSNGVLAISVKRSAIQPYNTLANFLYGLGYDGIANLLGLVHTVATVPDALPPPRSSLISSSMKPVRPNVTGCLLTDAAKALAKHVNRSKNRWWGVFHGSDSNKNKLALAVLHRLLNDCCWMNIHLIQPYGCVFEIRVPEGFGARWSHDGSKFIGFLEPYTEDGFSNRWQH